MRDRYWEQTDAVPGPPRDLAFASDLMAQELLLGLQIVSGAEGPSPAPSQAAAALKAFAAVWDRLEPPGGWPQTLPDRCSSAGGLFGRATPKQAHFMGIKGAYVVRGRGVAYFPNAVDRSGS